MFTVRSTQPGHPSVGRRNEYQPKGRDALQCGWGVKTGRPIVCGWQVKLWRVLESPMEFILGKTAGTLQCISGGGLDTLGGVPLQKMSR